jgi:hypothetical protein
MTSGEEDMFTLAAIGEKAEHFWRQVSNLKFENCGGPAKLWLTSDLKIGTMLLVTDINKIK